MAILLLCLGLGVSFTQGQEDAGRDATGDEPEKKNDIGVFIGALSNLDTKETGISLGVDYTRKLTDRFAITAIAEYANAGEREALFGAGIEVEPGGSFKLIFAPGVVLDRSEEEGSADESSLETLFAFRSGVGYVFELPKVEITPMLYFDLVDEADGVVAHLVYGLSFVFPF